MVTSRNVGLVLSWAGQKPQTSASRTSEKSRRRRLGGIGVVPLSEMATGRRLISLFQRLRKLNRQTAARRARSPRNAFANKFRDSKADTGRIKTSARQKICS